MAQDSQGLGEQAPCVGLVSGRLGVGEVQGFDEEVEGWGPGEYNDRGLGEYPPIEGFLGCQKVRVFAEECSEHKMVGTPNSVGDSAEGHAKEIWEGMVRLVGRMSFKRFPCLSGPGQEYCLGRIRMEEFTAW